MLGYSKAEWIFAGILGVVLFSWILWPGEKKPTEPKPERASSAEIMKCAELIKTSANNPSTVVLHELVGTASDRKGPEGTSRVKMDFEAKNAFGLELKFQALCLFAKGVPSIQISNR
ncbi:hypothetical protein [Pseudomonas sp. WS 5086]|uniref:hypothetical protein n=1 Tax=Pseudomonas sp. WS 5086 TaxID=2717484 RepID=UPI00147505E2|nr:hypothetical protein [Pseudomonas sp. WS 5086]NMX94952.1 hypothetical protein [Pseudomonas sp. WS 5086]